MSSSVYVETPSTTLEPVQAFREHWPCACGGELIYQSPITITSFQQEPHVCNKCGFKAETENARYPRIIHRPLQD